ncbi:MAG: hypothetical protein K2K36_06635 [Muribaculaceae bacterium]|nr:hypothetical protein [Muribaculaceae bacterium]
MSELDNLKKQWRSVSIDAPQPDGLRGPEAFRKLEKTRSARQRMLRRYRMILIVAMLGIANGVALQRILDIPFWMMIYFCLFMLLAGVMNFMQMRKLAATDVVSLPVVDAINFIKWFSRMRNYVEMLLIAIGLPLVVMLICTIEHEEDEYLFLGGIAGGIIGAILGVLIDFRFRADLKAMRKFLDDNYEADI